MHFVYVLYSSKINRYYIGETDDVLMRLEKHNSGYYRGSFTSQANDWEIQLEIPCADRKSAMAVEKGIKSRKSRKYIEDLIRYPGLIQKLKDKIK